MQHNIQIFHAYDLVAEITIDSEKQLLISYKTYTNDVLLLPFGILTNPSYEDFINYITTRCWDKRRWNIEFRLAGIGLEVYDPLDIVLRTHGVRFGDFFWFKFDTDTDEVCYDYFKQRLKK